MGDKKDRIMERGEHRETERRMIERERRKKREERARDRETLEVACRVV